VRHKAPPGSCDERPTLCVKWNLVSPSIGRRLRAACGCPLTLWVCGCRLLTWIGVRGGPLSATDSSVASSVNVCSLGPSATHAMRIRRSSSRVHVVISPLTSSTPSGPSRPAAAASVRGLAPAAAVPVATSAISRGAGGAAPPCKVCGDANEKGTTWTVAPRRCNSPLYKPLG